MVSTCYLYVYQKLRSIQGSNDTQPCSYCAKTAKKCSLNPHWANVKLGDEETLGFQGDSIHGSWVPQDDQNAGLPTPLTLGGDGDPMLQMLQNFSQSPNNAGWDTSFDIPVGSATTAFDGSICHPSFDGMDFTSTSSNRLNTSLGNQNGEFLFEANQTSPGQFSSNYFDCFNLASIGTSSSEPSSINTLHTNHEAPQALPSHQGSLSHAASTRSKKRRKCQEEPRARKDSRASDEDSEMSLSPFSALHAATVNSNRTLISESLLRIYHDVLENNLACWITEDTCPYQMKKPTQLNALEKRPQPEWGTAWSNRMYRRVKKLDRIAQEMDFIRLTSSQSHAASRALDLVIMAFATQWAQGKRRKDEFDRAAWVDDNEESGFGELDEEFEKNLQHSVWQQAKRALEKISDLECFRVIYAELVFGLIQKPMMPQEGDLHQAFAKGSCPDIDRSAIFTHIAGLMAQDGPPVFLERGTRKIHAMKYRLEAKEADIREAGRLGRAPDKTQTSHSFGEDEARTVDLLYWLAIMFDTVSSSINERPVVVGDDECEHDSEQGMPRNDTESRTLNHKWRLELYAQDDPTKPSPLQWPCPYEEATRAVSRSAAVKVLLFRYVSYLQNALRRKEKCQALEEIIQETLLVYRYWNKTHGAFFRDLTKNFDAVPARLKSWFPCISIPWHLGSLMLADLIDLVDRNHLGFEKSRQQRIDANMTSRIRRSSATELADLALVVTPRDMSTNNNQEQLQDFHFAVSDSSLLTEPWTILLVRGFAKAAVFHLGEAEDMRKYETPVLGHESREFQASVSRGEICVRALWFLGTKSDMAKAIARSLVQLLHSYGTEPSVGTAYSGSS